MQFQREQREDHGRDDEDQERHSPAEPVGEQAGGDRPDDPADGVRRPVEAVHVRARLDRVVVGDQGVVGRVDERLAERRPAASDGQHDQTRWRARSCPENECQAAGRRPTTSGIRFERSANWAIGTCSASAATDDSATIDNVVVQVDAEAFADVREQDAEGGSVEFVDGVQREQDEQRERGLAAADRRAATPSGGPCRSGIAATSTGRRSAPVAFSSRSVVAGAVTVDSVRR